MEIESEQVDQRGITGIPVVVFVVVVVVVVEVAGML